MKFINDFDEVIESKTFHQLGILVLDGSGSMCSLNNKGKSLADCVNLAVRDFLGYFKQSSIANNFSIAVVTFDGIPKIHTDIIELISIDDFADYNPMIGHGGGTNIGAALEMAETIADRFLSNPSGSIPHDVRILVMSDGECGNHNTINIANRIKQNSNIMICSSLFKSNQNGDLEGAKDLLLEIASSPNLYKTTYAESDLRQFFISSMSAKRNNE